jgi:hypothetical protein
MARISRKRVRPKGWLHKNGPHECGRRVRQIIKGQLKRENGLA